MAQSKLNDLAGKFGKGGPPGLGIGLKLLGVAGALVYGASQSVYTGKNWKITSDTISIRIWHNLTSSHSGLNFTICRLDGIIYLKNMIFFAINNSNLH